MSSTLNVPLDGKTFYQAMDIWMLVWMNRITDGQGNHGLMEPNQWIEGSWTKRHARIQTACRSVLRGRGYVK